MVRIYVLIDPITKEVRYVGITTKLLRVRLANHIYDAKKLKNHRAKWINSLLKKGLKPEILSIDSTNSIEEAFEKEKFYISSFKAYNINLVNETEGGEGALGRIYSDIHKQRISNSQHKIGIIQYSLTGEKIGEFDSIQNASSFLQVPATKIVACCKGKRRKTSNYQFRYKSDNIEFCIMSKRNVGKQSISHRNKSIKNLKSYKESWIKDEK